jgi:phosphatidyl-myo-inositol dimannoside synthase
LTATARTLLVTNNLRPDIGGIEQFNHQVLSRLPDAAAFARSNPGAFDSDRDASYPVYRGPHRYLLPVPAVARALERAIEAADANVLLFATPWPLVSLGLATGLPTAVVCHGNELVIPSRLPVARQMLAHQLRQVDLLYAVSRHTADYLDDLVGDDGPPVRLLRNGVDVDAFSPRADARMVRDRHGFGNDPVVVCVGRLVPRKGQDTLVEAWPRVRRAIPNARLLLVGDGPLYDDLVKEAADLPPGAVTLTGRVAWEELAAHHAAADVFAHPNRTRLAGLDAEGFGVIFLEAQAVGRPVVAGDSGGSPEALVPGETGVLVDGDEPNEVADAIIDLLSDRARSARMGRAGRRFVEEQHDWDRIVMDLHDQLNRLAVGPVLVGR